MAWCLVQNLANDFIKKLRDGTIDPQKLADMTSEERHNFFKDFLGEDNATQVNSLFESKLLLKNQQAGMIRWAKKVSGLTPQTRSDLISKINKMDKILNPESKDAFLKDLASTKLGVDISLEQAQKISELSAEINKAKLNITDTKSRVEYGNKILDLYDYTDSITKSETGLGGKIVNVANAPKSIQSSLDFSAPLRQGFGMITHPRKYLSAFGNMFKYAASEKAYRSLMADIITRPSYDLMKSSGLRITKLSDKLSQREEAFMSSLLDKVPGIKQSERAYTGFLNKLRADTFDQFIKQAERNGENVSKSSQVPKDLAGVINDFTGSGNIGKNDKYASAVPLLNSLFFSARKIAATINIFNPKTYIKLTPTARGLAVRNLLGMIGVSVAALSLAKLAGGKTSGNPTSADFGKAVFGNTHIDVTGGNANYLVLLTRLFKGKTTSTTTGISRELKPGYGKQTKGDVLASYIRNKLSPTAALVSDYLYGADTLGNPFSVKKEVASRLTPLVIQAIISSVKTDPSNALLTSILEIFGAGTQVYTPTQPKQAATKPLKFK